MLCADVGVFVVVAYSRVVKALCCCCYLEKAGICTTGCCIELSAGALEKR